MHAMKTRFLGERVPYSAPEQQALANQITKPARTMWSLSSQKKVFLSLILASRNKGSMRASDKDTIDLPSPQLSRPSFLRGGGGHAAGYQQQRELKQRFLINPENVESKSSAHGKDQSGMSCHRNDSLSRTRTLLPIAKHGRQEDHYFTLNKSQNHLNCEAKSNIIDCLYPE